MFIELGSCRTRYHLLYEFLVVDVKLIAAFCLPSCQLTLRIFLECLGQSHCVGSGLMYIVLEGKHIFDPVSGEIEARAASLPLCVRKHRGLTRLTWSCPRRKRDQVYAN